MSESQVVLSGFAAKGVSRKQAVSISKLLFRVISKVTHKNTAPSSYKNTWPWAASQGSVEKVLTRQEWGLFLAVNFTTSGMNRKPELLGTPVDWIIWGQRTHLTCGVHLLVAAYIKDKEERSVCSLPACPHPPWGVHSFTGIRAVSSGFQCTLKTN